MSRPVALITGGGRGIGAATSKRPCLVYTSDAADEEDSVDFGGRRITKKKKQQTSTTTHSSICSCTRTELVSMYQ